MVNRFYNLIPQNIFENRFSRGPFDAVIPGTNLCKNSGFHGVVKTAGSENGGFHYGTEYTFDNGPLINPWNNVNVIANVLIPYHEQALANRKSAVDSGEVSSEQADKDGYFRYGPKEINWNGKIYTQEDIANLYEESARVKDKWVEARTKAGLSPFFDPRVDLIPSNPGIEQVDHVNGYWPGFIPKTYTNGKEDDQDTSHRKIFEYANDVNTREENGENVDDEYEKLRKWIPYNSQAYLNFNRFKREQDGAKDWAKENPYPKKEAEEVDNESGKGSEPEVDQPKDEKSETFSNFSIEDIKKEWNSIIQEGLLDGRIKLYHGTKLKNKKSILEQGILGKYALDENNVTNSVNPKWGKLEGRNLVYLSKNTLMPNIIKRSHNRKGEKGTLLELSIPYDEYGKLKITDNPETRGENLKQKQDLAVKLYKKQNGGKKLDKDLEKYLYKILPDLFYNTVVVEGDIKPKFIIGSKKYSKNSLGEAIKYISDHPERFGSGVLRGLKTPKKLFD